MDISNNHHHHISPLMIAALIAAAAIFGAIQSGYLKHTFHKEILARIGPATVLTATDMVSRDKLRRAVAPTEHKPIVAGIR